MKKYQTEFLKVRLKQIKRNQIPKNAIEMQCPIHGIFFTTPKNHLQKWGCPSCRVIGDMMNLPSYMIDDDYH